MNNYTEAEVRQLLYQLYTMGGTKRPDGFEHYWESVKKKTIKHKCLQCGLTIEDTSKHYH